MNTQTLNRMIKASYSAPNGAQLRKACYGVMAVNSRKASVGAMSVEDLAELPKEEQSQVKMSIVKEALVEGSAEDQAKYANLGLKDMKVFMAQNGLSPEDVTKGIEKTDPVLLKAVQSEAHTMKDAIQLGGAVVKARSIEEILGFLDVPIAYVQTKYENLNWMKINLFFACIRILAATLKAGSIMGASVGLIACASLIQIGGVVAITLLLYYLFGNVLRWIDKRFAMIQAWVFLMPFRVLSLILKSAGWLLDKFVSGLKGAWNKFFSRQAKIAMQSPEFRRAYYSI